MACQIVAIPMTLSVLHVFSLITKCDFFRTIAQ